MNGGGGGGWVYGYVCMCVGEDLSYLGWAGTCINVVRLSGGLLVGRDKLCRCGSALGSLCIWVSKYIVNGACYACSEHAFMSDGVCMHEPFCVLGTMETIFSRWVHGSWKHECSRYFLWQTLKCYL